MLALLIGCQVAKPGAVKTRIVEVKVETVVPLDPSLTAKLPKPARPPANCVDADGTRTICNAALADWLNAYDALVDKLYGKLDAILSVQPKGKPAP